MTTTTNIPDMEDDFIPVPPPLMREMTGRVREENFIPMPRFLEREPTESGHKNEPLLLDGPDQAMVLTYLQYECKFDRCKYKGCTWGDIIRDNYDHFVELMAHEVYLDSNTFLALRGHVKEKDLPYVRSGTETQLKGYRKQGMYIWNLSVRTKVVTTTSRGVPYVPLIIRTLCGL